jgi:hypothetical protein
MTVCVTHGQLSPSRYMTPSCWTIRSQPSAGSQEGSSSASHMPPETQRRPGMVVRAASHAMGKPTTRPIPAAADDTHSELTTATAVAPVSDCCR